MVFDVSIDITEAVLTSGSPMPPDAAKRVRNAVQALPGAGWVSVEVCDGTPPGLLWLALYRPGGSERLDGGEWDEIARSVEKAVRTTLVAHA